MQNKSKLNTVLLIIIIILLVITSVYFFLNNHKNEIINITNQENKISENTQGDCFSETTPMIKIFSPNGGEVFNVGDTMQIKYTSCNMPKSNFGRYELQTYDIKSEEFIGSTKLEGIVIKPDIIEWKIPSFVDSTRKHKIYLEYGLLVDKNGNEFNPSDISDNFFMINGGMATDCTQTTKPWIKILSPNGGEVYSVGQETTIKWKTCNSKIGQTVTLTISQVNSSGGENPIISFFQFPHQISNSQGENIANVTFGPSYSTNNVWPFSPGNNFKVGVTMNPLSTNVKESSYLQDSSDNTFTIINNLRKKGETCGLNIGDCERGLKCAYPCGIQGCQNICLPENEPPRP